MPQLVGERVELLLEAASVGHGTVLEEGAGRSRHASDVPGPRPGLACCPPRLPAVHPSLAGFNPATAWRNVPAPLHPGAARAYREAGFMA